RLVHGPVVARAAQHGARGTRDAQARPHALEVEVDDPGGAGGLVHGRGAERGDLLQEGVVPGGAHAAAPAAPAAPRRRVLATAMVCTAASSKPASSSTSAIIGRPSSTGGLKGWPRSLESTEFSGPSARMLASQVSHATFPVSG